MESYRRPKKHQSQEEDKSLDATTSEIPEGSPLTEVKRIVYFQPFPKIESREEYDKFVGHRNRKNISYNSFKITRDDRSKTYEDYIKDFDELLSFINKQKQQIKASFDKAGQDVSIEVYTLPKTPDELIKLRETFAKLKPSDIFLISSHGNEGLVGIAEVSMNAQQLDIALDVDHLNLPNPAPFMVIWACNSATQGKDTKTTIIDELQSALQQRGMQSAQVSGVRGYLTTAIKADEDETKIVSVTRKAKKQNKAYRNPGSPDFTHKPIKQEDSLRHAATPESFEKIGKLEKRRRSLFTQLNQASKEREVVINKRQAEEEEKKQQQNIPQSPEQIITQQTKKSSRTKKKVERTEGTPVQTDFVQPDFASENVTRLAEENSAQAPKRGDRRSKKQQAQKVESTPVQAEIVPSNIGSEAIVPPQEGIAVPQTSKKSVRIKKQLPETQNSAPVQSDTVQTNAAENVVSTEAARRVSARLKERRQNQAKNSNRSQNDPDQTAIVTPAQTTRDVRRTTRFNLFPPPPKVSDADSITPANKTVANDSQIQKADKKTHNMNLRSRKKE